MTDPEYHKFYEHTHECQQCEYARPKHRWDPQSLHEACDMACPEGRARLLEWKESCEVSMIQLPGLDLS